MEDIYKERIQLWVADLDSGEHLQGKGLLARKDMSGGDADGKTRYCCLGRACEVYIAAGNELETYIDEDGVTRYDDSTEVLPSCVATWFGLADNNPNV